MGLGQYAGEERVGGGLSGTRYIQYIQATRPDRQAQSGL